ncbi:MAG: Rpn family recombination-promoting nuclease/putative transposase, partial [bacterium]|nr:Rpn family recombination-promoting nuclease/putative transposase [bacterium]
MKNTNSDNSNDKAADAEKKELSAHDEVVGVFLREKETAISYFQESLPVEITRHMDFKSLRICTDSFIDKALSKTFADILYEINFKGYAAFIYLLIEHKSRKATFTPLQQLKYMVGTWELYLAQNEKVKKLPVIIPLTLYHGESKWDLETNFGSLFEPPEGLERFVPDFDYNVSDISHIPDEEIKGTILLQILYKILKYIFSPQLRYKLPEIFRLFDEIKDKARGTEYLEVLLRYVARSAKELTKEELKEVVQLAEGGDLMASIAEQWVEEGIEIGEKKGEKKGKWAMVMNLLKEGLPITTIS